MREDSLDTLNNGGANDAEYCKQQRIHRWADSRLSPRALLSWSGVTAQVVIRLVAGVFSL
jgi:hypothetical protein